MNENEYLLPLTNDFVFKKLFTSNTLFLLDFLNSFFETVDFPLLKSIEILNPEILPDSKEYKTGVLDLNAEDEKGNLLFVEVQNYYDPHFGNRILYYSSGLIRKSLIKGEDYSKMRKVISLSILDFQLFSHEDFISRYRILNKNQPNFPLTDRLEIFILELKKWKDSEILPLHFKNWLQLFFIRSKTDMATKFIPKDHPAVTMALEELEKISGNREYQNIYEMRMKAEMDHASRLIGAEKRGIEIGEKIGEKKGIEKGEKIGIEKGEKIGEKKGLKKGILALHSIGKSPEEISILMDISLEEVYKILNSDEPKEMEEL